MSRRLLLIDVDATRAARVARLGRALGWSVELTRGAATALPRLGAAPFDLCLIHLALPAADATAVALKARNCQPPVPTAAIEASGRGAVDVLRAGAAEIVPLPHGRDELAAIACRLLAGQGRPARRTSGAPLVVGDDAALGSALAQLDAMAGCHAPVLIRGETGTGKATMARLLHAAGPRRDGRFVAINLAAVPPERAHAQLARHGVRRGWLAAARGGTLFLDEIDLLSPGAQAALVWRLRVARPLVRLVGATRHPVRGLVERGVLAPALGDLFGSPHGVVELPPLRARRPDIPMLAEHFRRQVNAREGRRVPGFALDVMRRFSQHDWPGNVRELQNLVEQLVITAGTRMVVMKDLPSRLRIQVLDFERAARGLSPDGIDPRELLAELEARFIAEALGAPVGHSASHVPQKARRRYVA